MQQQSFTQHTNTSHWYYSQYDISVQQTDVVLISSDNNNSAQNSSRSITMHHTVTIQSKANWHKQSI